MVKDTDTDHESTSSMARSNNKGDHSQAYALNGYSYLGLPHIDTFGS